MSEKMSADEAVAAIQDEAELPHRFHSDQEHDAIAEDATTARDRINLAFAVLEVTEEADEVAKTEGHHATPGIILHEARARLEAK